MTLDVGQTVFGIARQTAKGAVASDPDFAFGLAGGGVATDITQDPDKLTSAYLSPAGAYRSKAENGASIETRAWQKAIGLLLYGALGACSTSQTPAPVAIATSSVANPSVITTSAPHGQGTSGTVAVVIAGHTGSTPSINGTHTATLTGASTFTIPIDVSSGGTGGTVTFPATSYSHIITLGSALPYFTVFDKKSDGTILGIQDCKIDELEISWEENTPLSVSAKFAGGALSFPSFTPVVDESDTVAYYTPVGGTFKYDVDSATPAEAAILGGKIVISRGAKAYTFSGDIEAGDVMEGACSVEVALSVLPADMELWRTIATGADDGEGISSTPVYGSIEHTFVVGADSLKFEGGHVAFLVDIPEADPDGGAAESELAGVAYRVLGTPITATLVNTHASYTST